MDSVVQFVTSNWVGILAVAVALETAFRLVAKMTPTKVDDQIVEKIDAVLAQITTMTTKPAAK